MLKNFFKVLLLIIVFSTIYLIYDYRTFPSKINSINFAGEPLPEESLSKFYDNYNSLNSLLNAFIYYGNNYKIKHIESQLEINNLPLDLVYIPIIESKLQSVAVSDKGATGIWQFIDETAGDYNLSIEEGDDDRKDLEKSTLAALTYLGNIYDRFENWTLTLAAYNRGENAISKAMQMQNADNFYELNLNPETTEYIYKIIALKYTRMWIEEKKQKILSLM